ncbi:MAG: hypothetical protein HXX17_08085 [Geobacteraceae bacterium]|nr:hypothetical protein [Geobacteraceae bacterium]
MQRMYGSALTKLQIINHGAMNAMVTGKATKQDWDVVCTALNMAAVLADGGLGSEYLEAIKAAMKAHAESGRRYLAIGKFGFSGQELNAVNIGMDIHDAQLELATVEMLEKAHIEVAARIRRGQTHYFVEGKNHGSARVHKATFSDVESHDSGGAGPRTVGRQHEAAGREREATAAD